MKLIRSLIKDFKILARSKGSALVVLLAPLIIVLIIGIGYMDDSESRLNIGVIKGDDGYLTNRYIDNINKDEYNIEIFPYEDLCTNAIKEGVIVACIIFPEDFVLKDGYTHDIKFYVDESRMNLVHKLIASFTLSLGSQTAELTEELTEQLLVLIQNSKSEAEKAIALSLVLKSQANVVSSKMSSAKAGLSDMDVSTQTVSLSSITSGIVIVTEDYETLKSSASSVVSAAETLINSGLIDSYANLSSFNSSIVNLKSTSSSEATLSRLEDLANATQKASEDIAKLSDKLRDAKDVKDSTVKDLDAVQESITGLLANIDKLKQSQEKLIEDINSFNLKSASSIANPVKTSVEPITAKSSKLTYSFSYLLMLVILFVGLMLPSTLVFMEKDSKAFFRNFTTPTTKAYFLFITYLTSIIIIALQSFLILLAVQFGLGVPVSVNIWVTLTFLMLGATIFIFIGMLIGTMAGTSEAITMSTIMIGSLMLFLSNLVLPLETLSSTILSIARLNPYVIVSESIKKAMLFGADFNSLLSEMMLLILYFVIILSLIILVQKIGFKNYFSSRRHMKNLGFINMPEDLHLKIEHKNINIKNIHDLIYALKEMSDDEYKGLTKPKNIFSGWLKNNVKAKSLSSKIKNTNRDKAISILEKYLKKKN